jgi:hydroxyethylthiazole kinase-like uncharacterized protein yjeF
MIATMLPTLLPILPAVADHALHGVAQTRLIEATELARQPAPPLMQRAGEAIARLALAIAPHARRVWIAAGPGNNGGDGLEAALHLQRSGRQVEVALHAGARTPPDAQAALQRAQAAGVSIKLGALAPQDLGELEAADLAIDALLGIGGTRAPAGALAETIAQLNALRCPVLAADLPSGLDADTGRTPGDGSAIVAQHTLTLITLKPGLFTASGRDHAGRVWLAPLGVDPAEHSDAVGTPAAWLRSLGARAPRVPRRHAQHKGSFGDVAVVGGSPGMAGAALLAARAAHAAGAGRVYVELIAGDAGDGKLALDLLRPELMFRADWTASSTPAALAGSTVVCGCGGGSAVRAPLPRLLSRAGRLVLDADALNTIAADAMLADLLRARASASTVLTPHPLEAARLLGCSTAEVQADRLRAACELADRCRAIVVLKGSGSVVAAPGEVPNVNASGNASLASAGTGDVLAGWIGGAWAQDAAAAKAAPPGSTLETVLRAVAEHGAAAEPERSGVLRAGDLIERLYAVVGR